MLEFLEKTTKFIELPKRAEAEGYRIVHYSGEQIHTITEFIAGVYYSSRNFNFECSYESLFNELEVEDKQFCSNSDILCIYNRDDKLCCTGRIICKEYNVPLPFEKEFGCDLNSFVGNGRKVYELARLASNSKHSALLLYSIFRGLLYNLIDSQDSVVIAGLDKKVYDSFKRRGFPVYNMGEPKYYMGSYTIPIEINLSKTNALFENAEDLILHRT